MVMPVSILDSQAGIAAIAGSPELQARLAVSGAIPEENTGCWSNFHPRPDRPEEFDQQAGFCFNRDRVAFLVGGNAAGTTEAAAFKAAKFMLYDQPPPRPNTPFWIISNTYEQVCGVCWDEKLYGHGHIPECEVEWAAVRWKNHSQNWPLTVPLKPWPEDRGGDGKRSWTIEFKSYEQGRRALQARSIGGFWFSEQFPAVLFTETMRGCRDCMYPGGQFSEFTPIEPELCLWIEALLDDTPPGWRFYRANTELNKANLADGWYEDFFATVPEEMYETRKTGALATFEGVIFQAFNPAVHVKKNLEIPPAAFHYRGIDWGASEEHPFTCVWGCRDGIGDWYVYDEYWSTDQSRITLDHAVEIIQRSYHWGWPGKWDEKSEIGPVWINQQSPHHLDTFADPSRPGEINEFSNRGIITMPAGNDVFKGIDCLRSLLKIHPTTRKPKILIDARCKHLAEELRKHRWKKGRKPTDGALLNPQVAAPTPLKRDDDTVDALRYMIYSAELGRGAVPGSADYRSHERRRSVQRANGDGRSEESRTLTRLKSGWFQQ